MAGDWIKMESGLSRKPEVMQLVAVLGLDRYAVIGRLHTLWAWADENSLDGNRVKITRAMLDGIVELAGFAEALASVGWLAGEDNALTFPNFDRHNGESAKRRAMNARYQSKHRSANSKTESLPEKNREEKKQQLPELVLERGCPDEVVKQATPEEREAVQHVRLAWAEFNKNRPSHMKLPSPWLNRDNKNNLYATLANEGMAFIRLITAKVFSDAKHWGDQHKSQWGWGTICNYLQSTAFTSSNVGKPAPKPAAVEDSKDSEARACNAVWCALAPS